MDRTAIQRDKATHKLFKFYYVMRSLFRIIRGMDRSSYIVRKLNTSTTTVLKGISKNLTPSHHF